jgi:hypothetical protein
MPIGLSGRYAPEPLAIIMPDPITFCHNAVPQGFLTALG